MSEEAPHKRNPEIKSVQEQNARPLTPLEIGKATIGLEVNQLDNESLLAAAAEIPSELENVRKSSIELTERVAPFALNLKETLRRIDPGENKKFSKDPTDVAEHDGLKRLERSSGMRLVADVGYEGENGIPDIAVVISRLPTELVAQAREFKAEDDKLELRSQLALERRARFAEEIEKRGIRPKGTGPAPIDPDYFKDNRKPKK